MRHADCAEQILGATIGLKIKRKRNRSRHLRSAVCVYARKSSKRGKRANNSSKLLYGTLMPAFVWKIKRKTNYKTVQTFGKTTGTFVNTQAYIVRIVLYNNIINF